MEDLEEKLAEAVKILGGSKDKFVQSIIKQYKEGKLLSEKQVTKFLEATDNHTRAIKRGYGVSEVPDSDEALEASKYKVAMPMVHSDLDEYGLDPYEFRVYAHIVRRTGGKLTGTCFAKLSSVAEVTGMSVRKVQYSLRVLLEAGLIEKDTRRGRTDIYYISPMSNWVSQDKIKEIRERVIKGTTNEET